MQLLLTLLLAHLFADFPLQSNGLARFKSTHLAGVLLHALIYTIVTALLIERWVTYWPLVIGLGIVHFAIDALKPRLCRGLNAFCAFLFDQSLHLATMIVAAWCAHQCWQPIPAGLIPQDWLLYTLFAALLPALMVGYWVWATSSGRKNVIRHTWLTPLDSRTLVIEQRFGLVLLGVIILVFVR